MSPLSHVECNKIIRDLREKIKFVLGHYVESGDGRFTFPDGDVWHCGETGAAVVFECPDCKPGTVLECAECGAKHETRRRLL